MNLRTDTGAFQSAYDDARSQGMGHYAAHRFAARRIIVKDTWKRGHKGTVVCNDSFECPSCGLSCALRVTPSGAIEVTGPLAREVCS